MMMSRALYTEGRLYKPNRCRRTAVDLFLDLVLRVAEDVPQVGDDLRFLLSSMKGD